MMGLHEIVVVAGCAVSRSVARQHFLKFEENLRSIVSLARSLREKVAGMVSGDFEVLAVHPGQEFKEADMCLMGGERPPTGSAGTVLCMTQAGLTKWMPEGPKGEKMRTTVMKAEVVLK